MFDQHPTCWRTVFTSCQFQSTPYSSKNKCKDKLIAKSMPCIKHLKRIINSIISFAFGIIGGVKFWQILIFCCFFSASAQSFEEAIQKADSMTRRYANQIFNKAGVVGGILRRQGHHHGTWQNQWPWPKSG